MKKRIALGFVTAAILLGLLVNFVGSDDVLTELASADRSLLAFGLLSGSLALTFRGLVWGQFLVLVDETMPRRQIAGVFLTAMFVKYVTPYGQVTTEPFVAYLVARDAEMAYEDGLAGILSADLLNYVPYYTFGFLALASILAGGTGGDDMLDQFVAFSALFVVVSGLAFVVVRRQSVVYRTVLTVLRVAGRIVGRLTDRFEESLTPVTIRRRLDGFYVTVGTITTDTRTLALATATAHVGMVFLMLPIYLGALALGYHVALPVVAIVVALGKLGTIVPAPGGTGGVEAVVTAGLTTLGQLDPAAALTIALIYRACTYWLTICLGGCSVAWTLAKE